MQAHQLNKMTYVGVFILISIISYFSTLHVVRAYDTQDWTWGSTTVNYDAHLLNSTWAQIVSDARTAWNNVSPSPFAFSRNDTTANDIFMSDLGSTQSRKELTYCGTSICNSVDTVTRTTVEFNSKWAFIWHLDANCMVPSNAVDARSTATHELGHSATLGHSYSGTTMYGSYIKGGCSKRSLHQDDIDGLNAQYP